MGSNGASEDVVINGKRYRAVREGLASVLAPYSADIGSSTTGKHVRNNDEGNQAVFYNPIQQFNRDLSVLAITVYGEGAIVQKSSRNTEKYSKAKDRRKQKVLSESQNHNNSKPVPGSSDIRKRKADEVEDQDGARRPEASTKRPRTHEDLEDEDDLPVAQLGRGTEPVETVVDSNAVATTDAEASRPAENFQPISTTDVQRPKQPHFTILDALSATGLRAFRYAKEIPFTTNVVANDLSAEAVKAINLNIEHNGVTGKVHSNLGDARAFMYSKVGDQHARPSESYVHRFDVIDLDPYGTAAPFFDASLQALQDGGMLCVTCTDAGIFASTGYPEKTYAMYGGIPIKGPHSHEGGLRLILNAVATSAAKYGLAIEPLLSLYIDYYARLFIRVHKRANDVKLLPGSSMIVYGCGHGCGSWSTQPLLRNQSQAAKNGDVFYKYSFAQAPTATPNCEHCGYKTHLFGPMWAGPIHNSHFVQRMLDKVPHLDKSIYGTTERLEGMLTLALEEDLSLPTKDSAGAKQNCTSDTKIIPRLSPAAIDISPFFIMPTSMAKVIHCTTPSEEMIRSAILSLGYRVSRSHCKAGSIKTNAPFTVLWEIIREFMRTKHPIKEGAVKKGSVGWNILARLRGTERTFVSELKDRSKSQIQRCDTKEDLKTVLQGMLWQLEKENSDNLSAETGDKPQRAGSEEVEVVTDEADADGQQVNDAIAVKKLNIVFNEKLGREKNRSKLVRYQINPRENWGPMNRAGRAT